MVACNGFVHYLPVSKRTLMWRWLFIQCAVDVILVTIATALDGGFSHHFFHLLYYPALAGFAVFFTSFRLNMAFVTMVATLYIIMSLTVGDGVDVQASGEKTLLARVVVMYAVGALVNLILRFELIRWRVAAERERELSRQRTEISQTIHDTTAQSAYMLGLGLEDAMARSKRSNPELSVRLEALWTLSKSTMWELRHPIDGGRIFSGGTLVEVLAAHADTFTVITSIPAQLVRYGDEPELSTITRSLLFSIRHNALTNAFRHSGARSVTIYLTFDEDDLCLSVSDDGIGLPADYASRGHGFRNMQADAERLGGELHVESDGDGTSVSCVVPYV